MSTTIVALDLETTGLDPERHHIWEIGAIVRDHRDPRYNGRWQIMLHPNLSVADPAALRIGRYYERATRYVGDKDVAGGVRVNGAELGAAAWVVERPTSLIGPSGKPEPPPIAPYGAVGRRAVASWMAVMLDGATIVGANPAFDAAFMGNFLRSHGHAPTWHHHLVDVAALAAGLLACCSEMPRPPWRTADLADQLGIVCPPELRHTALGDADWALGIYDRVMTGAG